jgi:hypothetical protein
MCCASADDGRRKTVLKGFLYDHFLNNTVEKYEFQIFARCGELNT